MPRFRHLLPALLLLLMAVPATSAQESGGIEPGQFEGLQRSVMRSYGLDYDAIFAAMATPDSEVGPPHGVIFLWANILEFDSAEHAGNAMDRLREAANTSDGITVSGAPVSEVELDLGEESQSWLEVQDVNGQRAESILTLVRQETVVYFVIMTSVDTDAQADLTGIASHMIETPAGEGDGTFDAAGGSTGGLWDKFPPRDHPLLQGLVASDAIIYPEPTPAAA
jgi:hypothetical protein